MIVGIRFHFHDTSAFTSYKDRKYNEAAPVPAPRFFPVFTAERGDKSSALEVEQKGFPPHRLLVSVLQESRPSPLFSHFVR